MTHFSPVYPEFRSPAQSAAQMSRTVTLYMCAAGCTVRCGNWLWFSKFSEKSNAGPWSLREISLIYFTYWHPEYHSSVTNTLRGWQKCVKLLPGRELNPGHLRDRQVYWPLYYRGSLISHDFTTTPQQRRTRNTITTSCFDGFIVR